MVEIAVSDMMQPGHVSLPNGLGVSYPGTDGVGIAPNELTRASDRDPFVGTPCHPWAWLLARVFAVDVMIYPYWAGAMRLVKIATARDEIAKALASPGLGPRPPPWPRPAMLGQLEMKLGDA